MLAEDAWAGSWGGDRTHGGTSSWDNNLLPGFLALRVLPSHLMQILPWNGAQRQIPEKPKNELDTHLFWVIHSFNPSTNTGWTSQRTLCSADQRVVRHISALEELGRKSQQTHRCSWIGCTRSCLITKEVVTEDRTFESWKPKRPLFLLSWLGGRGWSYNLGQEFVHSSRACAQGLRIILPVSLGVRRLRTAAP